MWSNSDQLGLVPCEDGERPSTRRKHARQASRTGGLFRFRKSVPTSASRSDPNQLVCGSLRAAPTGWQDTTGAVEP